MSSEQITSISGDFQKERVAEEILHADNAVIQIFNDLVEKHEQHPEDGFYNQESLRLIARLGYEKELFEVIANDLRNSNPTEVYRQLADSPRLLLAFMDKGYHEEVLEFIHGSLPIPTGTYIYMPSYDKILPGLLDQDVSPDKVLDIYEALGERTGPNLTDEISLRLLSNYKEEAVDPESRVHKFLATKVGLNIDAVVEKTDIAIKWALIGHKDIVWNAWVDQFSVNPAKRYEEEANRNWVVGVVCARNDDGTYNFDRLQTLGRVISNGYRTESRRNWVVNHPEMLIDDTTSVMEANAAQMLAKGLNSMAIGNPEAAKYLLTQTDVGAIVSEISNTLTDSQTSNRVIRTLQNAISQADAEGGFQNIMQRKLPTEERIAEDQTSFRNGLVENVMQKLGSQVSVLSKLSEKSAEDLAAALVEGLIPELHTYPTWVLKMLNIGIEREGILSSDMLGLFTQPWENTSIGIEKTGSRMDVTISGPDAGTIKKTMPEKLTKVWERAADSIAFTYDIDGTSVICGTEPYMESTDVAEGTSCVHTQFCGFDTASIKQMLAGSNAVSLEQDLIEASNTAIVRLGDEMSKTGIIHGHPHERNFLISFIRKDTVDSERLNDPQYVNKGGIKFSDIEKDPVVWAQNPNDYYIVVRIIDFDLASPLAPAGEPSSE